MMNCDICGSKKVILKSEFQKLCAICHEKEIEKEEEFFDGIMINCRILYEQYIKDKKNNE